MIKHYAVIGLAWLFAGAAQAQTIDALTAGSALGGTEKFPMFQTANPAVSATAAQIKTFTSASPTLVTPVIGVATGTSLALTQSGNNPALQVSAPNVAAGVTENGFLESHDYGGGVAANNIVLRAGPGTTTANAPNIRLQIDGFNNSFLGGGTHIGFNLGGTPNSAVTAMVDVNGDAFLELRSRAFQTAANSTEFVDLSFIGVANGGPRYQALLPASAPFTINKAISNSNPSLALFSTGDTISSFILFQSGLMTWGPGGSSSRDIGLARNAAGVLEINSTTVGTFRDLKLQNLIASGQLNVTAMTQTAVAQTGTVCYNSGTGALTYDATVGCLTSTMEAKDGWVDFTPANALELVTKLRPGSFTYKAGLGLPDGPQVGFSAQQVATIDDRLVGHRPNGDLAGVRYQQTSALYAGAITALQQRIELLERKMTWIDALPR